MNDPFVSCPYDPCHQVPRSRLQKHLTRCEWRNPNLEACPFNATHRYTRQEMKTHVRNCPSKLPEPLEDRPNTAVKMTPLFVKPKSQNDVDEEEWDN